jgi:transposase
MYDFFIGIDVSKCWIDVAYRGTGKTTYLDQFANTPDGYEQMVSQLQGVSSCSSEQWFVCLENTGSYSAGLCRWLWDQQIPYKEEMPLRISKSTGLSRGKSDKYDAKDICQYAFEKRDDIQADVPDDVDCDKLRKLISRRNFLVKQKTSVSTSLEEQKTEFDAETYAWLQKQNEELLETLEQHIEDMDKMISEVIKQNESMQKNDELIRSVIGVGPVISATLIAYTNNFTRFRDAKKMANFISIAPHPNQSGTTKNGKDSVHPFGNKYIKSLLSNGAQSAIRYDREIKTYFKRKKEEGKEYGKIMNAVKNKLLHRIYAVVKRGTPYVPLGNYAC